MSLATTFDLDVLRRAHGQHDAEALVTLYAEDAALEIVDTTSPPSEPRRLEGIDAIRAYYEDVCARDMTHEVEDAFTVAELPAARRERPRKGSSPIVGGPRRDLRCGSPAALRTS